MSKPSLYLYFYSLLLDLGLVSSQSAVCVWWGGKETPPGYSGLFVAIRAATTSDSQAAPLLARDSSLINGSLTLGARYRGAVAAPRHARRGRMRSGPGAHLTAARGPQDGRAHAGLGPCGDLSPVPFPLGPSWAGPGRAVLPRAGLCRCPPHMEPRESWAALAVSAGAEACPLPWRRGGRGLGPSWASGGTRGGHRARGGLTWGSGGVQGAPCIPGPGSA